MKVQGQNTVEQHWFCCTSGKRILGESVRVVYQGPEILVLDLISFFKDSFVEACIVAVID